MAAVAAVAAARACEGRKVGGGLWQRALRAAARSRLWLDRRGGHLLVRLSARSHPPLGCLSAKYLYLYLNMAPGLNTRRLAARCQSDMMSSPPHPAQPASPSVLLAQSAVQVILRRPDLCV